MKKEDLLALGLTEEQADKVIGMNTQDVNQEKAQTTTAQTALAEAQGKLTTASEELEKLNTVKDVMDYLTAKGIEMGGSLAARMSGRAWKSWKETVRLWGRE